MSPSWGSTWAAALASALAFAAFAGCAGTQTEVLCDCAADEYCATSELCGAGDEYPTCAPLPVTCPADLAPVCGCDGATYDNACEANRAGTSVQADRACDAADQP